MPTFRVIECRGWYEAECKELGLTITARRLEEVEATARRSAERALGADAPVALVMIKKDESLLGRLAGFFSRSSGERHS